MAKEGKMRPGNEGTVQHVHYEGGGVPVKDTQLVKNANNPTPPFDLLAEDEACL